MKTSKEFRKVAGLADSIHTAKAEALDVINKVEEERETLDSLESQAKAINKL